MVERVAVLVGAGLMVAGVCQWSRPAAMILAGVLILAGVFIGRAR